ncbi:serine/threonine protein kinase [Archangium gephyra]|uniref:Serine/threonine protein kinase n=2 Tax=Archangium gephyra TaxID=48 RepID=A0ABX9KA05_9BACT|nr:serine/threonine protein kinase [Archangium gephyra]
MRVSSETAQRLTSTDSWGPPIPENAPQTATPFGKYLLIKRLAMGGMAELFLAQEAPNPDLLVIKRILPYLSEEPEFVQMFLDEARIAAQLHHPNIVQVFELGKIGESIFIAMEYLEGVDLRRILAEEAKFTSAVPYAVAARICAQVSAGLEYAHNSKGVDGRPLGLIHRDVSPQNVMVTYSGAVKLVDFGIAKAEAIAERSKPGVIKGKFLYLSPEQVMQERLDHRSDIFALGVMLYEITTGRSPFARPTTEGILYAIRFENPSPPHLIRDDYPQELSRIVMKCLVKDRNLRYQRAAQVQADLEGLLNSGMMRQSDDVAAYIARLLGEEEERTMLHVPIPKPGGRKDSSAQVPAGLVARPTRRPSAQNVPSAVEPDEAEPATEMARPRDMLAAAALGDEEDDEPTALRTAPGRASALPGTPPRAVTGESTLQDRPARTPASAARRPTPVRKPAVSGSVAALDRRRAAPPVPDEDEDEGARSVSVTSSTVNERGPEYEDEDEDSRNDSLADEFSQTHDLPSPPARRALGDQDDDESTAGYDHSFVTQSESSHPAPAANKSRGLRLVVAALVTLLVVSAGGIAWLFLMAPKPQPEPAPRRPVTSTRDEVPPESEGSPAATATGTGSATAGSTAPGTGTGTGPESATPETGTGTGTPTAEPGATGTSMGTGSTTPGTEQGSGSPETPALAAGGTPTEEPTETPAPAPAAEVRVQFKAPARTVMKVADRTVRPNGFVPLPPGPVEISYRCANRGPWRSKEFKVPGDSERPVVFSLSKRDCSPQRTRR